MPDTLAIHSASPDEVVAAHRNVFDLWGKGRSLSDHIRYRLTSPAHRRARWIVGCVEGEVVTSLGCHPFRFRVRGESVSGVGIASVYTRAEYRRRGFAARLLEWVHRDESERGTGLAVLFSDIDPGYYARLGYAPCAAFQGWYRPRDVPARTLRGPFRLVECRGSDAISDMAWLYDESERASPLSVARDESDWQVLVGKSPDDESFWLESPSGARVGYIRLAPQGNARRIMDDAVSGDDEELAESLYAALIASAQARGIETVGGWLRDRPATRRFFSLSPRRHANTILRPIAWRGPLDDDLLGAAGRCREIDHV
jgi:predicted N-acetyltransferase YhbS